MKKRCNWIAKFYDENDEVIEVKIFKDRTEHEAENECFPSANKSHDWSLTKLPYKWKDKLNLLSEKKFREGTVLELNKIIAKYNGYYQPSDYGDMLRSGISSFQVFGSSDNCYNAFPSCNIEKYYFDDIEEFEFSDTPKYHCSWDWLKPVIDKIIVSYLDKSLDDCTDLERKHYLNVKYLNINTDIKTAFNAVLDYINWYIKYRKRTYKF